jgi:hypothetical protein
MDRLVASEKRADRHRQQRWTAEFLALYYVFYLVADAQGPFRSQSRAARHNSFSSN